MFSNNLIIDKNNKILIPQNDKINFMIKKSLILKHSIEIEFDINSFIDMFNLYIIIKSYSCNLVYIPHNMSIFIKNNNEIPFIVHTINVHEFKQIKIFGFFEWFQNQKNNDWHYIKKNGIYSMCFTYPVDIFDRSLLNSLKPFYPWKMDLINELNKYINYDEKLKKSLIEKDKIIKELNMKIRKLTDPDYISD